MGSHVNRRGRRRAAGPAAAGLAIAVALAVGVTVLAVHPWRSEATSRNGAQPASVKTLALPGGPEADADATATAVKAAARRPAAGTDRTARSAVESYLRARGRTDAAASYALLSPASRQTYPTEATWVDAMADLAAPRSFTVTGSRAAGRATDVTADVRREPAVDAFSGFVPARSVEVYRTARSGSGWRVDAEPVRSTPVLPSDRAVTADVDTWLARAAACDGPGAEAAQTSPDLLGDDSLPGAICAAHARMRAGRAVAMVGVPATEPFVAAFGPDLGSWTRLVPVTGLGRPLLVGVAPLGSSWRVFGIVPGGIA